MNTPYNLDTATGIITIPDFVPLTGITVPEGTTHITFSGAMGSVDFAKAKAAVEYTNDVNLPYNGTATDVKLVPLAIPAAAGTMFYMLHISFYQEVNRVQYALNNGGFNSLAILDVV